MICHCGTLSTAFFISRCYSCDNDIDWSQSQKLIEISAYIDKKEKDWRLSATIPDQLVTKSKPVDTNNDLIAEPVVHPGLVNLGNTCFFNSTLQVRIISD